MSTTPLDLDAIEAVIRNATSLGADIVPETAAAMAAEIRRLRAELAAARSETLREAAAVAGEFTERFDGMDAMKAAGLIGPHTMSAAIRDELCRMAEDAAEETHVVADDSDDPEHVDDCPGCDGTRPCGHDDYHDSHEWADRPGVWCPGISYADDEPAAPAAPVAR